MGYTDLTGKVFGKLTVLERDKEKIGKVAAAYWLCKCECGNIKSVRSDRLKNGEVTNCGCTKKERKKDISSMVGKTFGRLTVLERDLSKPSGHHCDAYWICQCECGTKKSISTSQLTSGKTKSCGCIKSELLTNRNTKDIKGQKYGFLEAIKNTNNKSKKGCFIWECICHNCGSICYYDVETLQSGRVSSCGCRHMSNGEIIIEKVLIENNINYSKQYTFNDLKGKNNIKLRFDFAIFQDDKLFRIIEFDGEQHFNSRPYDSGLFSGSLEETISKDKIKNNYCFQHNIPIIRIPYDQINEITIENLLNNKFLITKEGE